MPAKAKSRNRIIGEGPEVRESGGSASLLILGRWPGQAGHCTGVRWTGRRVVGRTTAFASRRASSGLSVSVRLDLRTHGLSDTRSLPQEMPLQLARGGARQACDPGPAARALEAGQAGGDPGREFDRRHGRSARDQQGGGDLAPFGIGAGHHRDVGQAGMGGEHAFDLRRVEVLPAAEDQVGAPAVHGQEALGVEFAEVAGGEPAVGEGGGERTRRVLVAAEQPWAAHQDLADRARRGRVPARALDAQRHAGQRPPGAAGVGGGLLRSQRADLAGGLGQAIGLARRDAQRGAARDQAGVQGAAAGEDGAQRRRPRPPGLRVDQAAQHGRYHAQAGDGVRGERLRDRLRGEALDQQQRAARQRGARDHARAADVVERQAGQPALRGAEAEVGDRGRTGVAQRRQVEARRARRAGGAAGEQHQRGVATRERGRRRARQARRGSSRAAAAPRGARRAGVPARRAPPGCAPARSARRAHRARGGG